MDESVINEFSWEKNRRNSVCTHLALWLIEIAQPVVALIWKDDAGCGVRVMIRGYSSGEDGPSLGSMVQKGKFAAFTWVRVSTLKRDDFPTLGRPESG